jgi:uridylate kinase
MRAILKLSGQALQSHGADVVDREYLWSLATVLGQAQAAEHQVAVVVGGGNLFRFDHQRMDPRDATLNRTLADGRGMLATLFNGLWLQDVCQAAGVSSELFTAAFSDPKFVQPLDLAAARAQLDAGSIIILAGGTGQTGFSTDTAAVHLAIQLGIDTLLKATHTVDGVYSTDPANDPSAEKLELLSYQQALTDHLAIMDETALKRADDVNLTTIVFSIKDPASLTKVLAGETIGSIMSRGGDRAQSR